jgi:hypothetical protein
LDAGAGEPAGRGHEVFQEDVAYRGLHQHAIGTHTGLAAAPPVKKRWSIPLSITLLVTS